MNYMSFGLALAICSIPALSLTFRRYSKNSMSAGGAIFLVIVLCLAQLGGFIDMLFTGSPFWTVGVAFCLYAPLTWGLGWQIYQSARFSH